jgi:protein-tyrosine-phosphatase
VAGLLTAMRRAPDRLLHARRRAAAISSVRKRGWPNTVLVVCHGNICRSPYAAAILHRELAPVGVNIESAGFIGPGRASPLAARREAAEHGLDLEAHRSRVLNPDLVGRASLVITMDTRQASAVAELYGKLPRDIFVLGDFDPASGETRTIQDPIDQPAEVYRRVYTRIDRCALVLAQTILANHGAAGISADLSRES